MSTTEYIQILQQKLKEYIEGVRYVKKFFWKMEKLALTAKFETLT